MVSVVSFKKNDDQKALLEYQNAISVDDAKAKQQFENYCNKHSPRPTSFQELKTGFEKYVMELEKSGLDKIMNDPNHYRDYRAYVREHYVKQGKPWTIVYNEFWKEHMYLRPELYRNFVVFNKDGKKKVIEFYKWLDKKGKKTNTYREKQINYETENNNVVDLENKAFKLYSQTEMWKKLKKGENTLDELNWQRHLKSLVIKLMRSQLYIIKNLYGTYAKRNYYVYEINRVVLRFHKCFHTIGFPFVENELFLKVCIRKGLELSNKDGIPEGMYLLAKIYPDMICDDCCPWVNVYNKQYSETDVPRLLKNELFLNLSWCHTYWSEEYHMGINNASN